MNRKFKYLLPFFLLLISLGACSKKQNKNLQSPDGALELEVKTESGKVFYHLSRNGKEVLEWSQLGLLLDNADFYNDLQISKVSEGELVTENYTLLHGKQREINYQAKEKLFHFENAAGESLTIAFRLSNDGLALQYRLEGESEKVYTIEEEMTTYNFPSSAKAWMQPIAEVNTGWEASNPSYEEEYEMGVPVGSPSPISAGWVYPALFQSNDIWVLISEAGLGRDYCATRLAPESPEGEYHVAFPGPEEVFPDGPANPTSTLPWKSPWRVLAVGDLGTVVESTLGTDLANPQIDMDTDFVEAGQAAWSWALGKDPSITYDIQKEHIDFAAQMDYEHCLIDVNWDTTIGYDGIGELVNYAAEKGVKVHLWYNSAGSWNTTPYHPRGMLLTHESRREEFQKIKDLGVAGVKIDFFGGDGQSMIAYYHDILKDAAEIGLMVNFHGTTLPRGWHRTYPNLMTMESVKGFEMITFNQEFADRVAKHCAVLPFTRNVFDPMDFTPMSLDRIPNIERKTSKAFELALTVIYESGIQHLAESPEGMAKQPEEVMGYLKQLPNTWEETKFVDGFPGEFAVMARKGKENWYLAGINGSHEEIVQSLDLSFVEGTGSWLLITDNPEKTGFEFQELTENELEEVKISSSGGFVLFQIK
ncbi:glycoside hydrolase family 97 catalytic domain-containing protein [Echinicola jeungdonensis]|uniref:Glycoside hydrolase family 97 catalytic domain-containing protein n=1 Tax=Echinicola jeungdonensis TaxID=709343 RepID=A0ABV5J1I7_9BACT|nr:glycoside hydrolase family 97 protein [Echinicola jeungdonensis]MDN3668514.1 glycoside hydrolase family 97 catalytic domain-containing protein [Echinicola jeungdonensis]